MDIVERLRTQGIKHPQQLEHWRDEAADEIESCRTELEAVKKERDEFEEQRDAAWAELRRIRVAIGANMEESTADEAERIKQQRDELVNHLNAAANYIDTLGGVSQSYRIALAKVGADKTGEES